MCVCPQVGPVFGPTCEFRLSVLVQTTIKGVFFSCVSGDYIPLCLETRPRIRPHTDVYEKKKFEFKTNAGKNVTEETSTNDDCVPVYTISVHYTMYIGIRLDRARQRCFLLV